MSQHSFSIVNEAGAAFRSDVNSALQALASQSSGAAAPGTAYAYQRWADTTAVVLKQRNAANSAWLVKQTLDETFVLARSSNTILGLSDLGKTINATSSFTQTLTAAATLGDGWLVEYVNSGTGVITLDPNGAETINGQTTLALRAGESATIYCNGASFQLVNRSRYAGALAAGRNIAARTDATTPNSKINITADELQLKDANGNVFVATSVSLTIDMAVSGANGLDTGAEASSTWYYGWVIAKEDGTVAGVASVSTSAPTLPSGYTYKALATAVRNDGSSNFIKYRQFGNWCYYEAAQSALGSGSATVETAISLTSTVPPNAEAVQFACIAGHTDAALSPSLEFRVVSGSAYAQVYMPTTGGSNTAGSLVFITPNLGQNLYYIWTAAATGRSGNVNINGFKLPMGGE